MTNCNRPDTVKILAPETVELIRRDTGVDVFSATFSDGKGLTVLATPENVQVELFADQAAVWARVNPNGVIVRRLIDEPALVFHGSPDQEMRCKEEVIGGKVEHRHYLCTKN